MDPFRLKSDADQWEAIRGLKDANVDLSRRIGAIEAKQAAMTARWNWFITKFVPFGATIAIAFASLDTIFHWIK